MSKIKALTISQPYASLIADGEKWVENRVWYTSYRGPLAIHAGKGLQYLNKFEIKNYPTGCVVAIGMLAGCVHINDCNKPGRVPGSKRLHAEVLDHLLATGPWCWILEDVRKIEPVACRGAQGLWDWERPA